jgi:hypothetical protein
VRDKDSVLVHKRHDVGGTAKSDQIQVFVNRPPIQVSISIQCVGKLEGECNAREFLKGIRTVVSG